MRLQVIYELDKADKASVRFTGLEKCNCVQGGGSSPLITIWSYIMKYDIFFQELKSFLVSQVHLNNPCLRA